MSMSVPTWLPLIALIPALIAVISAWAAIRALRARRVVACCGHTLVSTTLLATALLLLMLAAAIHGYQRLTHEQPVAELQATLVAPEEWELRMERPDGEVSYHLLHGDDWRIEAQIIRWQGQAVVLGLDPLFRLERLSGRYQQGDREREAPRSVHDLADSGRLDLWRLSRDHPGRLPWVDSEYGSAAYLPLRDGQRYEVHLGFSGLIARPLPADAPPLFPRN